MHAVEVNNVTKIYRKGFRGVKVPAVVNLSFAVAKGAITGFVGPNGAGKTTTIAKLGYFFQQQKKNVLFGAGDTYRAAAVEQLKTWGERLNIPVIAGQSGGDPAAVAYDTVESAIARKSEVTLIDTAGRLHTRFNLMEELKKVYRVAGKAMKGAPHAVWLVMDATTGQNALAQAKEFARVADLDGVLLAKIDGTAKGGVVVAVARELRAPVVYLGVGEAAEDLIEFRPREFAAAL